MIYIARSFKYRQVSLTGVPVHTLGGSLLHATIGCSPGFYRSKLLIRRTIVSGLLFPGLTVSGAATKENSILSLLVKLKKERAITTNEYDNNWHPHHSHIIYF